MASWANHRWRQHLTARFRCAELPAASPLALLGAGLLAVALVTGSITPPSSAIAGAIPVEPIAVAEPLVGNASPLASIAAEDPDGPSPTMATGFHFMAALQTCLAEPGCANVAELLDLMQPDVRQTTIRADGSLHTREGLRELRALLTEELGARGIVGAEAIVMVTQEQNLVGTHRFHYDAGQPDHHGTFMLQLQGGRIAHWVVCLAPVALPVDL